MRKFGSGIILLCAISGGVQSFADDKPGDKVAGQAQGGYASPQEAFQARRDAIAKRDWKTAYSSMTPATQDHAIVEIAWAWLWLGSGERGHKMPWGRSYPPCWPGDRYEVHAYNTPWDGLGEATRDANVIRVREMAEAHGLFLPKFKAEVERQGVVGEILIALGRTRREIRQARAYLKEHPEERAEGEKFIRQHPDAFGTGITQAQPRERLRPDMLEPDMELEARVILSQIVDKAGFYEEAMDLVKPKVVAPGQEEYVFGDLEGVTVSGDKARGWVLCKSELKNNYNDPIRPGRILCRFIKINGRWYNDNREGDLERFDNPQNR